jgi:hypothetical protein
MLDSLGRSISDKENRGKSINIEALRKSIFPCEDFYEENDRLKKKKNVLIIKYFTMIKSFFSLRIIIKM